MIRCADVVTMAIADDFRRLMGCVEGQIGDLTQKTDPQPASSAESRVGALPKRLGVTRDASELKSSGPDMTSTGFDPFDITT